jgi:CheY-like chemotaxis protein
LPAISTDETVLAGACALAEEMFKMNDRMIMNAAHVYTRHEPASVLRARASEYRRMAAMACKTTDLRALDDLAVRFTELAEERAAEERMSTREPVRPNPLPSLRALTIATEIVRKGYIRPETILHPVIKSSITKLAYELVAYGLVPEEPESTAASERPRRSSQHVLVVDDSADVLVAVRAFLLGEGYVVVSAADGDTALRLVASDPEIVVLITDFAMPGLSGVELIAQAIQMRPDLKALMITAYPGADGLAELPSHIKVLTKPFRRAFLLAQVKALVSEASPALQDEAMELVENRSV